MDSPQPIGDTYMPAQQIELEEVQMVETSDEALEGRMHCLCLPNILLTYSAWKPPSMQC